jgi:hypothetical protein
MSPQAQQNRNISNMADLSTMEICAKVGIKKGTNGYNDSNQLLAAITPNSRDFLSHGSIPMQPAAAAPNVAQPQPTAQPSGAVPSWAQK